MKGPAQCDAIVVGLVDVPALRRPRESGEAKLSEKHGGHVGTSTFSFLQSPLCLSCSCFGCTSLLAEVECIGASALVTGDRSCRSQGHGQLQAREHDAPFSRVIVSTLVRNTSKPL